jgi:nitrogen regulatory protein P-II 1
MKKVEAVIQVFKLDDVKQALTKVGIEGLTVTEVRGAGREKGHTELYRGSEHAVEFLPRVKIELLLEDFKVPQVVDALWRAARTGHVGDGRVFVSPVEDVVRVRTGQRGSDAI